MVLSGSFPLYKQFFEEHAHEEPEGGWPKIDSYHFTPSQLKWFEDKGCTWKHVDAGPGDVILWDSRCIHYGGAPEEGAAARYATCEYGQGGGGRRWAEAHSAPSCTLGRSRCLL